MRFFEIITQDDLEQKYSNYIKHDAYFTLNNKRCQFILLTKEKSKTPIQTAKIFSDIYDMLELEELYKENRVVIAVMVEE